MRPLLRGKEVRGSRVNKVTNKVQGEQDSRLGLPLIKFLTTVSKYGQRRLVFCAHCCCI